jgi:ATP-dependent RNA helicase DeaD
MESVPGSDRSGRQNESQRPGKPVTGREGEFTQLFISIGRNRRVYARDLTELFTEKLQLHAGDIGGVRVFEKYSFVDIVPGKAGEAIARLSGSEVKGRTITVNYAKKKEEKEGK